MNDIVRISKAEIVQSVIPVQRAFGLGLGRDARSKRPDFSRVAPHDSIDHTELG